MSDAETNLIPSGYFARVALRTNIERGGAKLESILLREPKGAAVMNVSLYDLMRMEGGEIIKIVPLISEPSLTGPEALSLGAQDLYDIGKEISAFLLL